VQALCESMRCPLSASPDVGASSFTGHSTHSVGGNLPTAVYPIPYYVPDDVSFGYQYGSVAPCCTNRNTSYLTMLTRSEVFEAKVPSLESVGEALRREAATTAYGATAYRSTIYYQ
jgi:hypothetical protein